MQWLNEPASWQRTGDVLRVSVDPGTDFWRTTGYGYVHDNGHVYGEPLPGDLDVSVRVRGAFANQYDQAGIMLRADEHTWLKTGLEFFEGRPRLSTVLTMGCSSWMVADLPPGTDEVTLRVSRRGDAVEVRYSAGDGAAELAALVFMPPGREMLAGIVCAAPEGGGFSVAFHDLRIAGREWSGQETADDAEWAAGSVPAAGWAQDEAAAAGAGWDGGGESWGGERADGEPSGWAADRPGEAARRWGRDKPGEAAPGWAAETPAEMVPGWGRDKPAETAPGGGRDRPGEAARRWGRDKPGEAVPGWGEKEPGVLAFGWAGKTAGDGAPSRAGDEPGVLASGSVKRAAGTPAGGGGEPAQNGTVDWAKPQASEPAEDWDRLSLSVSGTGSWNAFEAAGPAKQEQKPEKAAEEKAADRATDQPAGRDGDDGAGERPGSPGGGKAEPALTAAGAPLAAAKPNGPNGRGRNKAKQPTTPGPAARSAPTDAADEWISLLTADSAEEPSAPGADRPRSTPGPRSADPRLSGPRLSGPGLPGPGVIRPRSKPWPGQPWRGERLAGGEPGRRRIRA
jgi:regulation of enolase protein 1 (concanavalin A-like superfamily)